MEFIGKLLSFLIVMACIAAIIEKAIDWLDQFICWIRKPYIPKNH